MKSLRKIGAAAGIAATLLTLSLAAAASASAALASGDEEIIDMVTCHIRGQNLVANGTIHGFQCLPEGDGPYVILHWW
jgi:Spy/CpxP family protein refolding chaperone